MASPNTNTPDPTQNTTDIPLSVPSAEELQQMSFWQKLKYRWKEHVMRNKAKSTDNRQQTVDNKAQKASEKETKNQTPTPEKQAPASPPLIVEEEFFQNFDPKKDLKKMTPEMKKRIIEAEKIYQTGVSTMKDFVAPSSMEVGSHHLKINGKYVKSFYVFNYPRFLDTNWMTQVINFPATMDASIFYYPENSSRIMKILRKKVAEMRSSIRIQSRKGSVEDVGLTTALGDAEELRTNLQKGVERFFQVGIYFSLYGDDEKQLETSAKQLETLLGGKLIMTRRADFRTERAFNTTLPQCTDEIEVLRNMNTGPASTIFPFVSSELTSDEGILYGLNRHNNSLIILDRFNLENANSVTFAQSGAGKSYAVKLEILRSLMTGSDVIILDPENEYKNLTEKVGGTHINISLTSPQRVNPFDLPQPFDEKEINTEELLRENIITLSGLLSLMLGKLSPEEDSLMDKALMSVYEIKGITPDIDNPHEYEMPTMNDLHRILTGMKGGQSLANRLEKYTSGTFSGLFGSQSNVDLGSGLICFCIRDLEEGLRPISMYILLNFIWSRVRSSLKKRLLVIDEAWNIVQHDDSGRFLHNLVKRARKYFLGISTITQDVEDFLRSPWGKPIITNSAMQLLLKQAPSAMETLKPVFALTDQEKYLLLNSGVGQGLFFASNQHVAIEIIASYGEDKIITTKPQEILEEKEKEK